MYSTLSFLRNRQNFDDINDFIAFLFHIKSYMRLCTTPYFL
jgi:hypothetical protein